jgi:hypothetical protein
VYFGAHGGGMWRSHEQCTFVHESVQVYVARCTHANYSTSGTQWRIPPILKDLTSSEGVKWFPSPEALVQAPVLSERIASKVMDFHHQRWWNDIPPPNKKLSCV